MRALAWRAMGGLIHGKWLRRGKALWMSAAAVGLIGLYRAATAVLIDEGARFAGKLVSLLQRGKRDRDLRTLGDLRRDPKGIAQWITMLAQERDQPIGHKT